MDRADNPKVTAVTMVYSKKQEDNLYSCIDSLFDQTYSNYEILVISENKEIKDNVKSKYDSVNIVHFDNDGGVSKARNEAIKYADGDILAYIDNDASADPRWLDEIVKSYDKDIIAVGGKSIPDWETIKPPYLPNEFLWLVGATHKNHPDDGTMVRSTFGCNMSFRKEVLEELGGFNDNLGKDHGYNLQGEEPELGLRMMDEYGKGMYYNSDAIVYHKVEQDQTSIMWLSNRAYLQGVTKAFIENEIDTELPETERDYFVSILKSILGYVKDIFVSKNRIASLLLLFGTLYFTLLVGFGYIMGHIRS